MQRKLELSKRKENTRKTTCKGTVYFCLKDIDSFFKLSIKSIDNNIKIAKKLKKNNKQVADDLLRYQIASIESAFDYFIHCIVKYGMSSIFEGRWDKTTQYKNYGIPLEVVHNAIPTISSSDWLLDYVDQKNSSETFLKYESFSKALNSININIRSNLIRRLLPNSNNRDNDFKEIMDEIYRRRNEIVHQDDRKHADGSRNPITLSEVIKYKNFLQKIKRILLSLIREIDNNQL